MTRVKESLEPPNGGWGWMVVVGAQLINVFNQSLLSVFGLLFGAYFTVLNESKARIALVMNLCSAFLNLTGLITAPLLKNFSPRAIAFSGCLFASCGLMLCSIVSSLDQMIFTYSFMVGVGLGLISPANFMAVNSYFTTKRTRAVGFAMAGTGLGQMILPQIVRFLLTDYGFRGAVLIMGSLSFHGAVGAMMFQPVRWHMRPKNQDDEMQPLLSPPSPTSSDASSYEMPDFRDNSFWRRLARSMDLSLLKDVRFVILNLGLACGYTVSIDFSLILPFFLQEAGKLDRSQTAICMSVLAAFDLLSRLTFHLFTDKLKISHRSIFMIGTLTLGIVRSVLAELTGFTSLLITCAFFGYFRALAVVNQMLCVSEFCTIWCPEKLPGALGLNMIIKGIAVMTIGQALAWFRDLTGSYNLGLHSQNMLLSIVMIIWVIELTWYKRNGVHTDGDNSTPNQTPNKRS